jgi:starvation-inducible DNA-binding protein
MDNKELIEQLKVVLATNFSFYLKVHNFHWNIEGPNFVQYHSFLDDLYNEVWAATDAIAEHIRTLDSYVPGSLSRFQQLSLVNDQTNIPSASKMMKELESDNKVLINALRQAEEIATKENCVGISNFLQDRIDIHFKHDWMLRSINKGQ